VLKYSKVNGKFFLSFMEVFKKIKIMAYVGMFFNLFVSPLLDENMCA
jgi:hypothetical protein